MPFSVIAVNVFFTRVTPIFTLVLIGVALSGANGPDANTTQEHSLMSIFANTTSAQPPTVDIGNLTLEVDLGSCLQPSFWWALHFLHGTLGLATMTTNGFTFLCFIKYEFIQTRTNIYILSMCVSDILSGLAMCLVATINKFFKHYAQAAMPCIGSCMLLYATVCTSEFSLVASALERYVFVAHPYTHIRYEDSRVHLVIVIVVLWILPAALFYGVLPINSPWTPPHHCHLLEVVGRWKAIAVSGPLIIVCLVIISVTSLRILLIVKKHKKQIEDLRVEVTIPEKEPTAAARVSRRKNSSPLDIYNYDPQKRQRKRTRMTLAIVVINIVSWVPSLVLLVARLFMHKPETLAFSVISEICALLVCTHSLLNPLIYHRLSPDMERAYLGVLCRGKICIRPNVKG